MKNKIINLINVIFIIIAILISLYFVVFRDNKIGLILKDLSVIITITLPYIIEKLFKLKIDNVTKSFYIIFVFFAHFLGAICEVYNMFQGFDKITHWLSGILTAHIALLLLKQMKKHNKKDRMFNILFMISITFMIAGLWEIFEFCANILFGGDAQRVAATGVTDTMLDIIVAFLGSIIYSIVHYFKNK